MNKNLRTMLHVVAVAASMLLAAPAVAEPHPYGGVHDQVPSGAAMAVDAVLVRPMGLVGTTVGSVLFVLSLPFSLLSGTTGEAAEQLVADPFMYTFARPLGDFHATYDEDDG